MKTPGSIVFLPCTDIEKTRHFYEDLLQLSIAEKQGDNLLIFDTGYGCIGFCAYKDQRRPLSGEKGVCISIHLSSMEEVGKRYEDLKELCTVYKAPAKHPDFPVYSFFLLDPDAYLVEYQNIVISGEIQQ